MKNLMLILTFIFISVTAISQQNSKSQGVVTDHEGNSYRTIKIGDQLWMAENLNTIHYSSGEKINSFCYDYDTAYCNIFGRLYTWDALNVDTNSDSLPGICPSDWHVPTDEEWSVMLDSIGGFQSAGIALRRGKYSDFNLRWGGNYQSDLNIFSFIDRKVYFWSSTEFSNNTAWMRMTGANTKNVNRSTVPKEYAFSIRCVKN